MKGTIEETELKRLHDEYYSSVYPYIISVLPQVLIQANSFRDQNQIDETRRFVLNSLINSLKVLPKELSDDVIRNHESIMTICWILLECEDYKRFFKAFSVIGQVLSLEDSDSNLTMKLVTERKLDLKIKQGLKHCAGEPKMEVLICLQNMLVCSKFADYLLVNHNEMLEDLCFELENTNRKAWRLHARIICVIATLAQSVNQQKPAFRKFALKRLLAIFAEYLRDEATKQMFEAKREFLVDMVNCMQEIFDRNEGLIDEFVDIHGTEILENALADTVDPQLKQSLQDLIEQHFECVEVDEDELDEAQ